MRATFTVHLSPAASGAAVAAALSCPEVQVATYACNAGKADGEAFAAAFPVDVELTANMRTAAAHAAICHRPEITEPRAQRGYQAAFCRACHGRRR